MRESTHDKSEAIKVLIADLPTLLASVVRHTVSEEFDMTVVEHVGFADEISNATHGAVDVVVTASPTAEHASLFQNLLFGDVAIPIVTISLDGKRIDVYGRATTFGGGIEGLATLIREAAAAARPRIGG